MDSPFSATTAATTATSSSTAAATARPSASITSSAHYFDPEEFFAMSSPNVRLRRSSRTAIVNSRSAVPVVASPAAAHTRTTVASASRSFTHSIFSPEAANASSASTSSSSTRAARKRRHHVEPENPEGQEASNCSSFPPPAKRRRCTNNSHQTTTTTSSKKRSASAKKPPTASMLKAPPPTVTKNDDQKPAAAENCCICMCDVKPEDVSQINGCDHHFCFGCIEKWAERENSCPLCKSRFTKIERVNKKRQKGVKNTKKVRQRDQRSDLMPGAAIEGLLASLSASRTIGGSAGLARIIFGVSGPGTGPFGNNTMAGHPASFGLLDSSDEDDEHPFSLLRFGGPAAGIRISAFTAGASPTHPAASFSIRYARLPHHTPPPPPQERARSHATNGNDATAGNRNNPLEINSDTDDEDSVQILDFD